MKIKQFYQFILLNVLSIFFIPGLALSQGINPDVCKEFLNTSRIYLIENNANSKTLTTSSGQEFTFKDEVKKSWPDKEIIEIDAKEYNKLKDVNNAFHLSISTFTVESPKFTSSISLIILQKGKTGRNPKKTAASININLLDILNGIVSERLIYGLTSLKELVANHDDGSFRTPYFYKKADYKNYLSQDTLYIIKSTLSSKLQNEKSVKAVFPYKFRLVTEEEWKLAITEKREKVLFIEIIRAGHYTGIDVYSASSGRMIFGSYPWQGENRELTPDFFKKMFK